ncbi:MAG: rod shape-determining protein MreC [Kiritimatiellaeota bacterium]|nr:rod shape-determining protein MreC [Kiritimatiellota bacterium]
MRVPIHRNVWTALPAALAFMVVLAALVPPVRKAAVGFATPALCAVRAGVAAARRFGQSVLPFSGAERSRLESLEQQVRQLRFEASRLIPLEAENRELRQRLALSAPVDWSLVTAPVLARDPLSWDRRFRVGRGRADGLRPGLAVLGRGGVIGRVAEVTETTGLVITLADPACRLSVRLPASGGAGVLHGGGGTGPGAVPLCFVDYLPRDLRYEEGEPVETSGLSGAVPEGLPIGTVTRFSPGVLRKVVRTAYVRLKVRPSAEFRWFRFVSILAPRQNASRRTSRAAARGEPTEDREATRKKK